MGQLAEFISNHPWLTLGLVVSGIAVIAYELWLKSRGTVEIGAADAVRLINKGALVIDVRDPAAFAAGHIVNAKNVPLPEIESGTEVAKKKNKVLVTVCDRGLNSGKAAKLLRAAGYESVFSLRGGLASWRADNLPVVK